MVSWLSPPKRVLRWRRAGFQSRISPRRRSAILGSSEKSSAVHELVLEAMAKEGFAAAARYRCESSLKETVGGSTSLPSLHLDLEVGNLAFSVAMTGFSRKEARKRAKLRHSGKRVELQELTPCCGVGAYTFLDFEQNFCRSCRAVVADWTPLVYTPAVSSFADWRFRGELLERLETTLDPFEAALLANDLEAFLGRLHAILLSTPERVAA